jgi:prepilin-type N-terminal cleavage/methylation domain-containing protein
MRTGAGLPMSLVESRRPQRTLDDGFTLIELVITVAIVGIVVVALTGMVMSYLNTTVSTQKRLTESHDVQFASAYWQRDVASIGVRSTTYDPTDTVHSFPLLTSVTKDGSLASCALPSGTPVVTLAWSQYVVTDPNNPKTVTVTYMASPSGSRYELTRRRCTGSTINSTVTVADNLTALPIVSCDVACAGAGSAVPNFVTMALSVNDPDGHSTSNYTTTLTGERRQT